MSEQAQQTAVIPAPPAPDPEAPDAGFDDFEELPARPRRRLATPVNLGLLAVLVVTAGFIAGVLVEKGQMGSASTGAGAGRRAAAGGGAAGTGTGAGAGRAGAGAAAAGATIGTVSTLNGRTLYVTDTQGTTIKVIPASSATVIRTATSPVSAIHPGDTVIVQGVKGSDGSVTASSIRATAPNAAGGGFGGLGAAAAGGTTSRAGTGSGAAAGGGGGGAAATPQLFGG